MIDPTMILFCLMVVFVFLAYLLKDVYVFGMASFFSILLGIQFATGANFTSGAETDWAFSILGLAFILFGVWLMVAGYKYSKEAKT